MESNEGSDKCGNAALRVDGCDVLPPSAPAPPELTIAGTGSGATYVNVAHRYAVATIDTRMMNRIRIT
jgi:hypothetical protein